MKILRIKTENILTFLLIPYAVVNISKASSEMLLSAIMIQALLIFATYYGTRETRKALIEEVKDGLLEELKEDLIESLEPIANFIRVVKDIKKEVIRKQTKTTKLKDAYLKI